MFSVQCSVFSVQCSVFSVQCSVFSVQCSVFSVQCSVFSVQCSVFSVQCSVFSVQCSVFSVQCSVFSVQCSVFSVQCSVFSVQWRSQDPVFRSRWCIYANCLTPTMSVPVCGARVLGWALTRRKTSMVSSRSIMVGFKRLVEKIGSISAGCFSFGEGAVSRSVWKA